MGNAIQQQAASQSVEGRMMGMDGEVWMDDGVSEWVRSQNSKYPATAAALYGKVYPVWAVLMREVESHTPTDGHSDSHSVIHGLGRVVLVQVLQILGS